MILLAVYYVAYTSVRSLVLCTGCVVSRDAHWWRHVHRWPVSLPLNPAVIIGVVIFRWQGSEKVSCERSCPDEDTGIRTGYPCRVTDAGAARNSGAFVWSAELDVLETECERRRSHRKRWLTGLCITEALYRKTQAFTIFAISLQNGTNTLDFSLRLCINQRSCSTARTASTEMGSRLPVGPGPREL